MKRQSGILLPVFSLPSEYGIGGFGEECYNFIDFLANAKQSIWQILPLVQTGYGNSPYSSVSAESFNPYYISPSVLKERGLLNEEDLVFAKNQGKYIDYGFLYQVRYPLLRKAFSRFDIKDKDFSDFIEGKKARDYALFMAIKYASGQKHFYEWNTEYKTRDPLALNAFEKEYQEEVLFWQFVQFEAQREWKAVKDYANSKGIKIMGDMPLYMALDSVDVWKNPELYKLDSDFMPVKKAGVPPDYFCADGQLWGNPVYDYDVHKKDSFSWWVKRIKNALSTFDIIRIDHFRGLDRFYEVEANATTARNGEWVKVPSTELFNAIFAAVGKERIVAEDLGILDDGVRELLKFTGYPGMKILSFAFNGEPDNLYLPEHVNENSVCYTGTHDNDTLLGLIKGFSEWDKNNLIKGVKNSLSVLGITARTDTDEDLADAVIELGFACKSNTFILPLADALKKDTDYRINAPGTVSLSNWSIRLDKQDINPELAEKLKALTEKYDR